MGRTPCCDKNGLKKGPWTSEEDQKLMDYIHKHGYGNWRTLPKNAGLQRCGKSCRLRWTNYLRPDIKRGRFSFEEEEIIIQLHSILGNKWSAIAARLPGRTDNEIKNYWNTHIRKRLLRMGIDPVTHNPRLDLLDLSSILTNSLYNNPTPHLNLSAMLAAQPLVNPQLLRLASSLLSSHQSPAFNQNHLPRDLQIHQNQLQQQHRNQIHDMPSNDPFNYQISEQQQQRSQIHDMPSNPNDTFNYQIPEQQQQTLSGRPDTWRANGAPSSTDNYIPTPTPSNYRFYNPDQPLMDNSIFSSTDNNFGAYATPSATSSPTPLNSNSTTTTTYNVNGSGTEDEREIISYCTDMLEFDMIPEFLGVSDFACNNF